MGENGEREQDVERTRHDPEHMLEMAWGLIANASDWKADGSFGSAALDLDKSREWLEAAKRWRDRYHEWLGDSASRSRLAQVVALLKAGEFEANIVANEQADSIRVKLMDGGEVLWTRDAGPWWSFTIVDPDGDLHSRETGVPSDATPEEVAKLIVTYQYPAPVEYPVEGES